MSNLSIKDYICKELTLTEQQIALDFISYLEDKDLTFYKDNCDCWKDKIYYWVKLGKKCVCFIAIKDPDENENHWTVWSDDMGSEWLENYLVDNRIKKLAWKNVSHCGHCGSCSGGRRKVIFGKEFSDVCGCTFRIDNPTIFVISNADAETQFLARNPGEFNTDTEKEKAVIDSVIRNQDGTFADEYKMVKFL